VTAATSWREAHNRRIWRHRFLPRLGVPVAALAILDRIHANTNLVVSTAHQHPRATRRRIVGSWIVAAGIAVTVAGGGYAAAADAGVLPNPWSGPATDSIPFVTSPDPVGTVRLAVPGPESTTLEIVTKTVTVPGATGECTGLVVKEPRGRSEHLMSGCGGTSALQPENGVFEWQATSGTTYAIVTGAAPAGATKVALRDRSGTAVTEPVGDGYFVAYAPKPEMPANGTLDFYNSSGQLIGSQNFATQ
jgi:hypothetical protein